MKKASEWVSTYGVDTKCDDNEDTGTYMSIDGRCVEKIQLDAYQQALLDVQELLSFTAAATKELSLLGVPILETIKTLEASAIMIKDYSMKCDPINRPLSLQSKSPVKVATYVANKPNNPANN
jgi:hypothetical protein